jgi:hypothetical protein
VRQDLSAKFAGVVLLVKSLIGLLGDPGDPSLELLFDSVIETHEKLKALGFTYYEGKVSVIDLPLEEYGK